ncbi:hypothetical protein L1282_001033 [Chryseobacterium sp. HSC-36S06]|nr:hypothetical protein [Chryseobacterium sp. HSC-36S06]
MVLVLPLLLITACREDADRNWTTPEASFKLHDTTLGATVLYPSMENNPYILTWDKVAGASSYSVVVSSTEDFATKAVLGASPTNTLISSIGELNTAMLQAGISPYAPSKVYVRVENGSAVSNTISFTVTPYPVDKPVITKPTAGQSIVLDAANPLVTAATVMWTDYSYGTDVNYNVEIAPKGSSTFSAAGSTVNTKELAWSNFTLNDVALKAGLPVGVSSEVDVRVTATTTSTGGTITKVSDIVTFKVTPYQPAYVNFYLVGGGTAVGWNAGGAQLLKNTNEVSEIYTYLEQNGEFRFLGQQDWGPINYSLNADGINDSFKYFNTWSSNLEPSGNENMKFTGNSGMYKITINQNSRDITVTPSSVPTLPTNVYLVGSIQGWNAGAAIEMTQVGDGVFEHTIVIPDGAEFKFLGQQDWSGMEWGNIHTGGNSGFLGPNGDNNNIQYNGGGNTYVITANIKLGIYKVTPQ